MTDEPRPLRLDERVEPGWANTAEWVLRLGGIALGLLLIFLASYTGGFYLPLIGVLALVAVVGGWLLARLVGRASWYRRPNARPLTYALMVGAPIALVLFAQVFGGALTPPATTVACFSGTLAPGEERHDPLPVDPRITGMTFDLEVGHLDSGALRVYVQDPYGQSQWSERVEAAQFGPEPTKFLLFESGPITPIGGQWVVNVIAEGALHPQFQLEWRAITADHPVFDAPSCFSQSV